MRKPRPTAAAAAFLLALAAHPAAAEPPSIAILTGDQAALRLTTVAFPGGKTVNFNHGIGSGAFRHPPIRPMSWSRSATAAPTSCAAR